MKHILKGREPIELSQWKSSNPKLGYGDLQGEPKQKLKDSLIIEQKYICCYCECRISSHNSHIEHFKPKDNAQFPQHQLVYNNLHLSCVKEPTGAFGEHCGHRKQNLYSKLLVSPIEEDCHTHFSYQLDGIIEAVDDRGTETINVMRLDSSLLNEKRKALIDFFIFDVEDTDRENELTNHLNGRCAQFGEFHTMIEYLTNAKQLQ
ncbi:hypothetical protein AwDysgo_06400 [Bacteroidales bacterium]|nr:hypothetical protein AwDysgo_06400 [Bacteroidales bacterium]